MKELRETVSMNKACKLVQVSRRTLYNWMELGKVDYVKTASGNRRIILDTLWKDDGLNKLQETVSITEACYLANISRRTMLAWIDMGRVKFVRLPDGSVEIVTNTIPLGRIK